ncbi:MAG: hypothetical protein AB1499_02575 [Nitrospirota bacterium]
MSKDKRRRTLNHFILNRALYFLIFPVLFFCLAGPGLSAADITGDNAADTAEKKAAAVDEKLDGEDTIVDAWHRALSGTITGSADWIDSFFYDERYEAEENRSRLLVRLESFTEEGQGTDLKLKASLRMGIPYAQKRLKLIVVGEPDEEVDVEGTSGSTVRRSFDRIDRNDVSVSLQHAILQELNRYISTRLGFVFRNWKPRLFLEGRYRIFFDLDKWGTRFTERLRWYTDKGWESRSTLDFERPLTERFFFRTTLEGDWLEDQNGFPHSLTFAVSQFLSKRRAIEYSLNNSFQTSANYHLDEVTFKIRYRQRIWRDWLFYDIEPQLRLSQSDSFTLVPGIFLRMEAIIGQYKRL